MSTHHTQTCFCGPHDIIVADVTKMVDDVIVQTSVDSDMESGRIPFERRESDVFWPSGPQSTYISNKSVPVCQTETVGLSDSSVSLVSSGPYIVLPQINAEHYEQTEHIGKMKLRNRHCRRRTFGFGSNLCRTSHDVKKLHNAISAGNTDLVEELLLEGIDACSKDDKQRSALHIAAARGSEQIVRVLLDYGANPNQKDSIGNTALHLAACTNNVPVVTLLLHRGTDINALDDSGRTPLHLAVSRLRLIHDDRHSTSIQLKTQVSQIIDMMKAYLHKSCSDDIDALSALCNQLELTTTHDEIDTIGGLLTNFANCRIHKLPSSTRASV